MYQLNIDNAEDLKLITIEEALTLISPKLIKVGTEEAKAGYFYDADTDIVYYRIDRSGAIVNSPRASKNWPHLELQGVLYHGVLYESETTIAGFNERYKT